MSVDHIRYDLLVRDALRNVVRRVVADVAKNGLPGDHHFYICFETGAPGVRISPRLREKYPQEMTIVLQHQFWDLAATDAGIEVGLSFGGIAEKLFVPFDALKSFFDPSVQFGLEFESAGNETSASVSDRPSLPGPAQNASQHPDAPAQPVRDNQARARRRGDAAAAKKKDMPAKADDSKPQPAEGGAEVVRLDRFRKK
jgi:hypothetical protein